MRPAVKSKTAPTPARWIYVPSGVHQPDLALELRDLVCAKYLRRCRDIRTRQVRRVGGLRGQADRAHAAAAVRRGWVGTCLDRLPDHDGYCAAGTGPLPRRLQQLTRRGQ